MPSASDAHEEAKFNHWAMYYAPQEDLKLTLCTGRRALAVRTEDWDARERTKEERKAEEARRRIIRMEAEEAAKVEEAKAWEMNARRVAEEAAMDKERRREARRMFEAAQKGKVKVKKN